MKETPFKEKVEALLNTHDAWFIKYWAGNKFTKEGIPDLLACIYGRFYGIELKGDNGRPKLLQLVKLRDIREAGGIGILLYPKDLKNFDAFINDPASKNNYEWYCNNIQVQDEWFEKLNL